MVAIGPPKRRARELPVDLNSETPTQLERELPVFEPVRPLERAGKLKRLRQMVSTQDNRISSAEILWSIVEMKSSHASVLLPVLFKGLASSEVR